MAKLKILGANALIFVRTKFQKDLIFGTILLTFFRNWSGWGGGAEEVAVSSPPPVPIGATGLELIRLFQFLNLFQPAVIFKKVQNL